MYKRFLMDFVDLCRALSYLSFLVVFEGRRDLDVCGHWLPKTLSFRVRAIIISARKAVTTLSQMYAQLPRTVHCVLVIIDD